MDGDASAKTMDKGVNSAIDNSEFSSGIHESVAASRQPAGEKTQGTGTPAFSASGSIGSKFTADGAIGGTADKIGGPFARDGAIGSQFNADGKIGGAVEKGLGNSGRQ